MRKQKQSAGPTKGVLKQPYNQGGRQIAEHLKEARLLTERSELRSAWYGPERDGRNRTGGYDEIGARGRGRDLLRQNETVG